MHLKDLYHCLSGKICCTVVVIYINHLELNSDKGQGRDYFEEHFVFKIHALL